VAAEAIIATVEQSGVTGAIAKPESVFSLSPETADRCPGFRY
jgi:hypothetical protein